MKAYVIKEKDDLLQDEFYGTMQEVKKVIQLRRELKQNITDLEVAEVDIPTDKDTILRLMNGCAALDYCKVGRGWAVTARGGLAEYGPDENEYRTLAPREAAYE